MEDERAVVVLVLLAAVTSSAHDAGWLPGLFLVAALLLVVWRAAYDTATRTGNVT
jgi:hypothetical protein